MDGGLTVALDLAATMDAIAANLRGVAGIRRVYEFPAEEIAEPCAVVAFPEEIEYDLTFGRGADRATFPVWVVVSMVSDRTARDRISAYVSHEGATEIKAALDGDLPDGEPPAATVQSARVTGCRPGVYTTFGGVAYLAARFDVDVIS